MVISLEGIQQCKISGERISDNVGVAHRINRNLVTFLRRATAEICCAYYC